MVGILAYEKETSGQMIDNCIHCKRSSMEHNWIDGVGYCYFDSTTYRAATDKEWAGYMKTFGWHTYENDMETIRPKK